MNRKGGRDICSHVAYKILFELPFPYNGYVDIPITPSYYDSTKFSMIEPALDETSLPGIQLDQFLKVCGIVGTGGQAKLLIQGGQVRVNGEVETRRKRQLFHGDLVLFADQEFHVEEVK